MDGFHVFLGMPEPDPETRKKIEEEADRRNMAMEAESQRMLRFFDELDREQVSFLSKLFTYMARDEHSAHMLSVSYMGYTDALLAHKFGACLGCGEVHDDEFIHHLQGSMDEDDD